MFWIDYTVESGPNKFRVKGDWDDEVMGKNKDGSNKDHWLYKPGDVFVVGEDGWLHKSDHLSTLIMAYEEKKNERK
jgi:hypothetical protein